MTADERPPAYRWVVLAAYMLTGIVSQLLWISFAPVDSVAAGVYGVSRDTIGLLSLVYLLVYVLVSIPVGYVIDASGFRRAILIGSALLALSGVARALATGFALVLAFQALGAFGQPFILNSISKLVRGWFPEKEAALATGVGTLSILLGLAFGLGLTPTLVDAVGFSGTLLLYGGISVAAFLLFYALGRESTKPAAAEERVTASRILEVLKDRNILLLSVLFFLGLGLFNAVATWIEPMVEARGLDLSLAGPMAGLMILGGIVGAVVIPGLADRYHTLRRPLLASLAVSAVLWSLLGILSGLVPIAATFLVLGFFFVAALPLGLELSARSLGGKAVGTANAVVWEFSQAGGIVFIVGFQALASLFGWGSLFFLSSGLVVVGLAVSALLRAR
ncbi:MAG TPA: MFS transporter [Thermoplasmata archaeon]|nr:MFS transporter [Thermoplasmata archaeon]